MREREGFLDKLRVLATCGVVLIHVITGVMDTTDMGARPVENTVFLMLLDLVCWGVPVFVMISGYLFLNPAREVGGRKIVGKSCRRIVLALFLFGVPFSCLELAQERNFVLGQGFSPAVLGEAFRRVLRGEGWAHMWYLYLILVLYLLTPFLRRLLFGLPRWAVYVFLGLLLLRCSILPGVVRLFWQVQMDVRLEEMIYLFYYICGYVFATAGSGKMAAAGEGRPGLWAGRYLPGLALLLAAGIWGCRLAGIYSARVTYAHPYIVALSLLLFGWGWAVRAGRDVGGRGEATGKAARFWGQAASLSFAVYLIHPLFINLAYKFFQVTPLSFPIAVSLPLFYLAVLGLSVLAAWGLRKIPPLRRYVL